MTAWVYYNEFDQFAASWLRELIDAGHIAPGDVDTRSIEDVKPADLQGYDQCHFFAGIGGWSLAARIAGIPDDYPLWTGSCPCQPFSTAGKGAGFADERHLWPAFHWLIRERRPAIVVGEQVASKAVDPWIDLVLSDLEGLDYAGGAIAFPSAGIGAPHIRDRTYWMAHANDQREHALLRAQKIGAIEDLRGGEAVRSGGRLAGRQQGESGFAGLVEPHRSGPVNGPWRDSDWLGCRDGKWRPVEPGTFPLAHGLPARVGRLRGYGNAINPWQAAHFLQAAVEAIRGLKS